MYPPRRRASYATFAAAIAHRYGAGGTFWRDHSKLPVRPLFGMEIWNEPSSHSYWLPGPDPAAYVKLAKAASHAVKSIDPRIKIVVSGDLLEARSDFRIVPWLKQLLLIAPHMNRWADALSVHAYPNPMNLSPLNERGDARLRFNRISLIEATEAADKAAIPIWITEIGWSTAGPDAVSNRLQAAYLTDAVSRGLREYGRAVQYIFPFLWARSGHGQDNGFGLREANGSPKPAWRRIVYLLKDQR